MDQNSYKNSSIVYFEAASTFIIQQVQIILIKKI